MARLRGVAGRLVQLVPVLFLVTLVTFLLVDMLPGDPVDAILGENATPETTAALRQELGRDEPLPSRYVGWLGDAVTGDFGESVRSDRPVLDEFLERLPVTLEVALLAQVMAILVAVPLALLAARWTGGLLDRATSAGSFALVSLPPFQLALMLVFLLALTFQAFPVSGWAPLTEGLGENLRHAFLPALALALGELAVYTQILRADLASTLEEDYILAARSKGLPAWYVLVRHALRPSSFSLVTLAGLNLGRLLGGTVIVETIFGLPGVGRLLVQAIPAKDMPVIQGAVLILAVGYLAINTLVDMSYSRLDPRLRRAAG